MKITRQTNSKKQKIKTEERQDRKSFIRNKSNNGFVLNFAEYALKTFYSTRG